MKRGKQGQFYLIAAIMIIAVMMGFLSVMNYAKKTSSIKLEDIRDELLIETQQVSLYDLNTGQTKLEDNFTKLYSEYLGKNVNIYYLTGNKTDVEGYKYLGGSKIPLTTSLSGENASLKVGEVEYWFKLEEGKNFYFVLTQELGRERYVIAG